MSQEFQSSRDGKIGLIVVHGVGEAEIGTCVNTLAFSLQDKLGYAVKPHSEVSRLPEPPEDDETPRDAANAPLFRAVRRLARHPSGREITLDELYWADLTLLGPSRMQSFLSMIRLIFESHHFVDAMLAVKESWLIGLLRRLLLVASWIMRGPIAALTIEATATCALLVYGPVNENLPFNEFLGKVTTYHKFLFVQIIFVIASAFGLIRTFKSKDASWYDVYFWLGVTSALLALGMTFAPEQAVLLANLLRERAPACAQALTDDCYVNVPYGITVSLWFIWTMVFTACITLVFFMGLFWGRSKKRALLASIYSSFGVIVLQFMLWTLIVVTALFPVLNRAELITGLSVGTAQATMRQALKCDAKDVEPLQVPICNLINTPKLVFKWIEPFKMVYAFTAIFFFTAVALMILVYLRRLWLARVLKPEAALAKIRKKEGQGKSSALPRLIFSPLLLTYLMFAAAGLIAVIVFIDQIQVALSPHRSVILTLAAAAAIGLALLAGHRLTNVIHIARDILDHHYSPKLETAYLFFPWRFQRKVRHPRRWRIQGRLRELVRNLEDSSSYAAIIFVAHSQGTVVAFDYLAQDDLRSELGDVPLGFVTCGSPLGHIYEKYFHEYRPEGGSFAVVEERVSGWTNIAKIDDYIGGTIGLDRETKIDNRIIGRGGHMNYWTLEEVAHAIDEMIDKTVRSARRTHA